MSETSSLSLQLVEIKIVRQPNSVYRMRYRTDTRQTNLFADDSSNQSTEDSFTPDFSYATQTSSNSMDVAVSTPSTPGTSASLLSKSKKLPPKLQVNSYFPTYDVNSYLLYISKFEDFKCTLLSRIESNLYLR